VRPLNNSRKARTILGPCCILEQILLVSLHQAKELLRLVDLKTGTPMMRT